MDRGKLGSTDRNETDCEVNERRQKSLRKIEGIMRNAMARGQLAENFNPRLGALTLYAFMDGMVMAILLNPKSSAVRQEMAQMIDAFFFMLRDASNPYLMQGSENEGSTGEGR